MIAPTASDRARYCRFVHTETAPAKPMHNKGSKETNSEGFSAHPEPSRRSAAHVRRHPASWGRLCEVLDRILAVVQPFLTEEIALPLPLFAPLMELDVEQLGPLLYPIYEK